MKIFICNVYQLVEHIIIAALLSRQQLFRRLDLVLAHIHDENLQNINMKKLFHDLKSTKKKSKNNLLIVRSLSRIRSALRYHYEIENDVSAHCCNLNKFHCSTGIGCVLLVVHVAPRASTAHLIWKMDHVRNVDRTVRKNNNCNVISLIYG